MNLSHYRLDNLTEIDLLVDKIGVVKFYQYQENVFKLLASISPEQKYSILENIRQENQEVFIKCVCVYIIRTTGDCNVELSNDYTSIKGIEPFNKQKRNEESKQNNSRCKPR